MCEPISATTWIGMGIAAAGAYASHRGQVMAQQAAEQAKRNELLRQKKFQDEATTAFNKERQQYEPAEFQGNMQSSSNERQASYASQNASAPTVHAITPSGVNGANKVVGDAYSNSLGNALKNSTAVGAARANMGGFNDALFNAFIGGRDARDTIGMMGQFAGGSANVLPYELDAASHRGDKLAGLGSLLSTIGMIVGAKGGAKDANIANQGNASALFSKNTPQYWMDGNPNAWGYFSQGVLG